MVTVGISGQASPDFPVASTRGAPEFQVLHIPPPPPSRGCERTRLRQGIKDYAGNGLIKKYLPCTGLAMGIFPETDPGRVDFPPEFRTTSIPSTVARWRLARCSVLPHRSRNRQRRPAGPRHHGYHGHQVRCGSGNAMCTMVCWIWLAAFICQAGFHQRLVDPVALSVPGFSTARFPSIPPASLDLISSLTFPG